MKFGDANIILSSRVNENSKILYDRSPRERVQKVAPWLTVDSDALPAVVDGKIVWVLDGYTTSDKYPLAEKKSLQEMTSDAINPRSAYATLPTDHINYMRNAVKATVDAYDGTVTLYEWDTKDPILKAWKKAFPDVVKPKSEIPDADLLDHMRYPEDLFKVQRDMLAAYHVLDPKTFYEGNDKWDVPQDPVDLDPQAAALPALGRDQVRAGPGVLADQVYVPQKQAEPRVLHVGGRGRGRSGDLRQVPDPAAAGQHPGARSRPDRQPVPARRQGRPTSCWRSAGRRQGRSTATCSPCRVGRGLLYVQPLYTLREGGAGNYPVPDASCSSSFGREVGIGSTLSAALDDVLSRVPAVTPARPMATREAIRRRADSATGGDTQNLPVAALRLLQQASEKFAEADRALKAGDLEGYAEAVEEAQALVQRALNAK